MRLTYTVRSPRMPCVGYMRIREVPIVKKLLCAALAAICFLAGCAQSSTPSQTEQEQENTEIMTETNQTTPSDPTKPWGDAHTVVYPLAACYEKKDSVRVTVNGYEVPVTEMPGLYDYCAFSFDGTAQIAVSFGTAVETCTVSPQAKNIPASVDGDTVSVTLTEPEYIILTADGTRPLVIAADALETDRPDAQGEGVYNVLDYGADPSGEKLSTAAINRAITEANAAGGGTVYVPAGVYTVANVVLQSDVTLYLEGGSVLSAYTEGTKKYTWHYDKMSVSMSGTWLVSTAPDSENIRICGRGTIDAHGTEVRTELKFLISPLVSHQCSGFTVDGITVRDGGLWSTMLIRSDNVTLTNTKHLNENDKMTENDAIDVLESQHVRIVHTLAISEDDAYSLKCYAPGAGEIKKSWVGSNEPNEDVLFEDCFAWSRCGAFKVGYGVFGGMHDITFRDSYVYSCMTGINITHYHGSSDAVDIVYENIDIERLARRSVYNSPCQWLVFDIRNSSGVGNIRNVTVKNINVRKNIGTGLIRGIADDGMIENVTISGVTFLGKEASAASDMALTVETKYVRDLTITK